MAIIKSLLGKLTGSIGNFVFRNKGESNILAKRPGNFLPGIDAESVKRRIHFKMVSKLAGAVNQQPELKYLWSKAYRGKRALNVIHQKNYPLIIVPDMTGNIALVPGIGFSLGTTTKEILAAQINVTVSAIGTDKGINPEVETGIKLFAVIYLSIPVVRNSEQFTFAVLKSSEIETDLNSALNFSIVLNDYYRQLFEKYSSKTGFFVLLTFDENGSVIHHSNTFNQSAVPTP